MALDQVSGSVPGGRVSSAVLCPPHLLLLCPSRRPLLECRAPRVRGKAVSVAILW